MGIIEDLQQAKIKAKRSGAADAKFLVNRRTYEALCGKGVDKSMLIISDIPQDGDCVMVKETLGTHETALSVMPEVEKPETKKGRATKKKYRYKKRKK